MNHLKLPMGGKKSALLAVLLAAASLACAQQPTTYKQTNIISDGAVPAVVTDPSFVDPWGISIGQDFWINTNVSGFDYVNDAAGNVAFKVTIPSAAGAASCISISSAEPALTEGIAVRKPSNVMGCCASE